MHNLIFEFKSFLSSLQSHPLRVTLYVFVDRQSLKYQGFIIMMQKYRDSAQCPSLLRGGAVGSINIEQTTPHTT